MTAAAVPGHATAPRVFPVRQGRPEDRREALAGTRAEPGFLRLAAGHHDVFEPAQIPHSTEAIHAFPNQDGR